MKPIHVVKAIAAKTQSELDAILPELKAAIRDRIRYLRAIIVETICGQCNDYHVTHSCVRKPVQNERNSSRLSPIDESSTYKRP
jgi:hypothetical protein